MVDIGKEIFKDVQPTEEYIVESNSLKEVCDFALNCTKFITVDPGYMRQTVFMITGIDFFIKNNPKDAGECFGLRVTFYSRHTMKPFKTVSMSLSNFTESFLHENGRPLGKKIIN